MPLSINAFPMMFKQYKIINTKNVSLFKRKRYLYYKMFEIFIFPSYLFLLILSMQLLFVGRQFLNRTARQATFWKPKYYEAIPHYVKPHFIDIHDS